MLDSKEKTAPSIGEDYAAMYDSVGQMHSKYRLKVSLISNPRTARRTEPQIGGVAADRPCERASADGNAHSDAGWR